MFAHGRCDHHLTVAWQREGRIIPTWKVFHTLHCAHVFSPEAETSGKEYEGPLEFVAGWEDWGERPGERSYGQ